LVTAAFAAAHRIHGVLALIRIILVLEGYPDKKPRVVRREKLEGLSEDVPSAP